MSEKNEMQEYCEKHNIKPAEDAIKVFKEGFEKGMSELKQSAVFVDSKLIDQVDSYLIIGRVKISTKDGSVNLLDGATIDEASREFYEKVDEHFLGLSKRRDATQAEAIKALEKALNNLPFSPVMDGQHDLALDGLTVVHLLIDKALAALKEGR